MAPGLWFFERNRETYEGIKRLAVEKWPGVFDPRNPLPLALGSEGWIAAGLGITVKEAKVFLTFWTRRNEYHEAVRRCGWRYALDHAGKISPAGPVEQAHKDFSTGVLAKRRAKATWRRERHQRRKIESAARKADLVAAG